MAKFGSLLLTFSLALFSLSAGGLLPRSSITNDFEAGTTYPWFDNSPADVHWVVEDVDSPLEITSAPRPVNGTKYLRAYRGASGTAYGLAVFSSPSFTALPGDNIFLNFWIRSQHTGGNSLEVYYVLNGIEERILNLGIFSSPSNFEWRSASAAIPITEPTEMRLVIYGYCGGVREDAIAIDNIIVRRPDGNTTTTLGPETTATTRSTTTSTTSSSATTTTAEITSEATETAATSTTTVSTPTHTSTPTITPTTNATTTPTATPTTTPTTTATPPPTGCSFVLTASSGEIKTPNYPGNYQANSSCTWLVKQQDPYKKIKFDFIDFVSETCCDALTIYDGETESSQVLLKHQGTYLPTPTSVTSTVPSVLLKFTSDYAIQHAGFWIEYSGVY